MHFNYFLFCYSIARKWIFQKNYSSFFDTNYALENAQKSFQTDIFANTKYSNCLLKISKYGIKITIKIGKPDQSKFELFVLVNIWVCQLNASFCFRFLPFTLKNKIKTDNIWKINWHKKWRKTPILAAQNHSLYNKRLAIDKPYYGSVVE